MSEGVMKKRTIVVFDNGQDYSDHSVYFVQVADMAEAHNLRALVEMFGRCTVRACGDVEWYDGEPATVDTEQMLWEAFGYGDEGVRRLDAYLRTTDNDLARRIRDRLAR